MEQRSFNLGSLLPVTTLPALIAQLLESIEVKMYIPRVCTVAVLVCAVLSPLVQAAPRGYPERPIRYIVPAAAGGGPDTVARLIAADLAREFRHQIVVDNRPGAGGTIGMNMVARASPDGYTIGHANILNVAIVRSVMSNLPYSPQRDLKMVVQINTAPNILAATLTLPVKSVKELIDYAKKQPDRLLYAYAGTGTSNHLGGELFKLMTGTSMLGVPYQSAPQGMAELMTGRIHLMYENISSLLPHVRTGRVRGLGVTSIQRSTAAPELPSIAETLPGFEVTAWAGIAVPAKVPDSVVLRLNSAINKALAGPALNAMFKAAGLEPAGGTAGQFAAHVEKEAVKWADVIKQSGVKIE